MMSKDAWIAEHEKIEETLSEALDNFIAEMLDLGFGAAEISCHIFATTTELLEALKL